MARATAAGWYPDPSGNHVLRYWSGTGWSGSVSDGCSETTEDPLDPHHVFPAPGRGKPTTPLGLAGCLTSVFGFFIGVLSLRVLLDESGTVSDSGKAIALIVAFVGLVMFLVGLGFAATYEVWRGTRDVGTHRYGTGWTRLVAGTIGIVFVALIVYWLLLR